jgi:DegV family protein with EDD domain
MFKVVTDSTAYFTKSEAERAGIFVVPMSFNINDKKYLETYSDRQQGLLKDINKNPTGCKTSQPNISNFLNVFNEAATDEDGVLCVTISSRLSGAFNGATVAAGECKSKRGKILVFDSLSVAGGEKLIVEKAAELSNQGKTVEEAFEILTAYRDKVNVMFSVNDMEALRRSGRIGFVKQSISNILNIVPLLRLKDGAVESVLNTRGLLNFVRAVKSYMPQRLSKAIIMGFDDPTIESIKNSLAEQYKGEVGAKTLRGGAILAIHLGSKSFGIAWD